MECSLENTKSSQEIVEHTKLELVHFSSIAIKSISFNLMELKFKKLIFEYTRKAESNVSARNTNTIIVATTLYKVNK